MANTKIPSELSSTPSISDSGDATAITINSSEQVGIGISPSHPLHISSTEHTQYQQHRQNSSVGTGQEMKFAFDTADGTEEVYGSIYTEISANTNGAETGKVALRVADAGTLGYVIKGDGGGDTTLYADGEAAMILKDGGNVGIANLNPQFDLDTNEARLGYYSSKGLGYNFFTTSINFSSGTSTKYIAISYTLGLFYNLDLDLHGQYGNFNAEGGIRKVYTGGVNASDSNIYGNGNAQLFSLGNTATYYSTGAAAKSGTAKIRIPITGTSLPAADTLHVGIRMFGIHLDRITSIAIE